MSIHTEWWAVQLTALQHRDGSIDTTFRVDPTTETVTSAHGIDVCHSAHEWKGEVSYDLYPGAVVVGDYETCMTIGAEYDSIADYVEDGEPFYVTSVAIETDDDDEDAYGWACVVRPESAL